MDTKYVITIGRQFGSGGRQLGKMLAAALGIAYYDKELMLEAAKKAGLSPDYFERKDERVPTFLSGIFSFNMGFNPVSWYQGSTSISDDAIYHCQSDVIKMLADRGPCVIVGRSADYVLRDYPNVINIFVHAPMDVCVKRIMERADCDSEESARLLAEKTNKLRANYYNFYTDKRWGAAAGYDLTFDSSMVPMEDMVDIICRYVRLRTDKNS